jgi:hypothetical protein
MSRVRALVKPKIIFNYAIIVTLPSLLKLQFSPMGNITNIKLPNESDDDRVGTPDFPSSNMQSQQTLPTYEESTQSAMEIRTQQVEQPQTPEDLLEPLLPDELSMDEKRKLSEDAPDAVFGSETRTVSLETQLGNANSDELAQRITYRYYVLNASLN